MSIEPSHAHTVYTPRALPPKPERVPLKPALSFEEDARRCRERFRKIWGVGNQGELAMTINANRKAEAERLRGERGEIIMQFLAERQLRTAELIEVTGFSEASVTDALRDLRADGRVEAVRRCATSVWRIVGAAE